MLFSRTTKHSEHSALIVLVESGAVRVGIVLHTPGTVPTLVYETTRVFDGAVETSDRLIARMLKAIGEACDDVTKDALPHIVARRVARGAFDSIRFVYGAPWYISRGRTVTVHHDTPTAYSSRELDALIDEQGKAILPTDDQALELIERFATGWSINGYAVHNPANKAGTRLMLNLFASAVPVDIKHRVEEAVARSFHAHTIQHHSMALTASVGLMNNPAASSALLLITVTGAMTELALLSHDAVLDVMTFPEGVEQAYKAWGAQTGRLHHEARTHAKLSRGTIAMSESWRVGMGECLGALLAGRGGVERIVVLADATIERTALSALRDIYTPLFGQATTIESIGGGSLGSGIRVAAGAAPGSTAMRLVALATAHEMR